jgi:hypothetical protein
MKLPAGRYIISDPCYIIADPAYDRLLLETEYFGLNTEISGGVFTDSETQKEFAVFSTKYGDGAYQTNLGTLVWVDAGCVGCIPIEMVALEDRDNTELVIDFTTEFEVDYKDGIIIFGQVQIDTDPTNDFDFNDLGDLD